MSVRPPRRVVLVRRKGDELVLSPAANGSDLTPTWIADELTRSNLRAHHRGRTVIARATDLPDLEAVCDVAGWALVMVRAS